MCEICRRTPCDCRCPNAEQHQSTAIDKCCKCNKILDSNYTYWIDIECNKFCSRDCAHEYYGLQEVDE